MCISWSPVVYIDVFGSILTFLIAVYCLVLSKKWNNKKPDDIFRSYIFLLTISIVVFAVSRSVGHLAKQILLFNDMKSTWQLISPFSGALNSVTFVVIFAFGIYFHRFQKIHLEIEKHRHNLEVLIEERTAELNNANLELQKGREQLSVTLHAIGDGVISTDVDGKILLINKITEKLTGWTQQEAIGKPIQEVFTLINEKTGKPCENPVKKVLATGQIVNLANHTVLIAKDGTQYTVENSGAPIFSEENEIVGAVLVYRDVTEERRIKDELVKVKKLESVGVLAGGIAHDFNNILAAILGNIELAELYTEPTNKAYSLLGEAKKASIRAKDLTQQLLTFAKGGSPVKQSTSIGKIITDSANFVLHGSSVVCNYNIPDNLWQVEVDTGQISQVIQNIIINARHAMPEGGMIEVSCQNIKDITTESIQLPDEEYIKITISDSGTGIPEKYLEKIFDPYFSTKQEGSGLGLAICYSIISKHDGNISVQSKANKGTTFTIYLPASENTAQKVDIINDLIEAKNKATIMVMDDDSMVRNMTKQMLTRCGHDVLLAKNGHEAIEIYTEYFKNNRRIDIIIMDLTIPGGMGGKDAVQEILRINPDAKVVVASGYSNDPVMAHCQKYGFKASIAKPFRIAELNKLTNEILK